MVRPRERPRFDAIVKAFEDILDALFEDWRDHEGVRDTPRRAAKALLELLQGYWQSNVEVSCFNEPARLVSGELVVIAGIRFASICEHHLLPFFGLVHVAYRPSSRVIGLSKIPRIVDVIARRLQLQERMTGQIAEAVINATGAEDVIVLSEAIHTCECLRGVKTCTPLTVLVTRGRFSEDASLREHFLRIIEPYRLKIRF